jgi:hypothetical protein
LAGLPSVLIAATYPLDMLSAACLAVDLPFGAEG